MKLSAEQVQGIAELREKLQEKLEQLQREIDMTILNIDALDAALMQSSFTRASQYTPPDAPHSNYTEPQPEATPHSNDNADPIMVNDSAIGGISKSDDKISIILYVPVSVETLPFKTFFISRVIEGMIKKDEVEVENGGLSKDLAMRYEVKAKDDMLDQIIIYNYRLEERASEINTTIRWTLSRMLKNAK